MDIKLEKKPWYIRYRYYLAGGVAFLAFLIYVVTLSLGPSKLRIEQDNIQIAEVKNGKFMEYVDVEGVIQPILTIKVNARETGSVERIIGEEGSLLRQGDTILVMENPDLLRSIEDQRDDWEKQLITYREKEIEMEQKSLNLQQQALQTDYDLNRLRKSFALDKEEYRMGIKSKAQLEVSEDEYNYKVKNAHLQRESLRHDSAVTVIRKDLIRNDRERERKKYERACERLGNLVVKAPVAGQLSFVKVTPGQQVASGESIAEIKVLDQYKVHTSLSEYYIDRIITGLPATINYQGRKYPLRITKVVPEVKDRTFDVDLVFTGDMPDNVRVGKSFRVQIELGQPEEALVIPRGNFYQSTGGQWIYKLNAAKTKAVRVPLGIGRQNPQGTEVSKYTEAQRTNLRKGVIGFVFQSFNLIDELNVYENIELPLLYMGIPATERKRRVETAMERMAIMHRSKHFPQQLSGGQQQRVAIARAVVSNPKLILADEPTGNLDSKNGKEVMELLNELNKEGTTIVMVTHSQHDVTSIKDPTAFIWYVRITPMSPVQVNLLHIL